MARRDGTHSRPLTEPVLLILTSLADGPRHGYALLKDVLVLSHGRVRMSTGTLYGALRRLLENGWIDRFEQEDTARDKQAYQLAPAGRAMLLSELARMQQLARTARALLRTRTV